MAVMEASDLPVIMLVASSGPSDFTPCSMICVVIRETAVCRAVPFIGVISGSFWVLVILSCIDTIAALSVLRLYLVLGGGVVDREF